MGWDLAALILALGLLGGPLISGPAAAQPAHGAQLGVKRGLGEIAPDRGANPNEGLQPNGCVKLCPLDTNPCDPPEYKKADGRCNLQD